MLVHRIKVGVYARRNNVGAGPGTTVGTLTKTYRHVCFAQGVFPRRGGTHLKLFESAGMADNSFDSHTCSMDRAVARGGFRDHLVATFQFHEGYGRVFTKGAQFFEMVCLKFLIVQVHNQHTQIV